MAVAVQARLTAHVQKRVSHLDFWAPAAADRVAHVGHEVVDVALCHAAVERRGVELGVERRARGGVIRREARVCSVATCNVCRVRLIILYNGNCLRVPWRALVASTVCAARSRAVVTSRASQDVL